MQFQFDARRVAPSQGQEKWPAGWYQVVITGSDIKRTQNNSGSRLVFTITGNDASCAGKTNTIGLNIENPNATAVQIAYETLSAICWVIGKPAINDLAELHGVPFYALADNQADQQSNNWRAFKNMSGVDAVQLANQGGGTTARQAQAPAGGGQQAPAGGGWAPAGGGQQAPAGGGWAPGGGAPAQAPAFAPQGGQPPQGGGWGGAPAQQPQGGQPAPAAGWTPPGGAPAAAPQGGGAPAGWTPPQQGGQPPQQAAQQGGQPAWTPPQQGGGAPAQPGWAR